MIAPTVTPTRRRTSRSSKRLCQRSTSTELATGGAMQQIQHPLAGLNLIRL
jgi:hypothetical protein